VGQAASQPPAEPKRYRVLNSVGRRLIASFDTEEEAFDYIIEQPGSACRFAIEDAQDPRQSSLAAASPFEPAPAEDFAGAASARTSPARRSAAARLKSPISLAKGGWWTRH
jgi:hypothetical protein